MSKDERIDCIKIEFKYIIPFNMELFADKKKQKWTINE
jgi:hypothetical protein